MPIFEFHCDHCRFDFDELVRHDNVADVACPRCGRTGVDRKLSVFAPRGGAAREHNPQMPRACGRCGDPAGPCAG